MSTDTTTVDHELLARLRSELHAIDLTHADTVSADRCERCTSAARKALVVVVPHLEAAKAGEDKGRNEAIDWLLNSPHLHQPVVEHFWHLSDGEKCDCSVAL